MYRTTPEIAQFLGGSMVVFPFRLFLMTALIYVPAVPGVIYNLLPHHRVDDVKHRLLHNSAEPVVFRMLASQLLSTHYCFLGYREEEAVVLREGIALAPSLTAEEANRPAVFASSVGSYIHQQILPLLRKVLMNLESGIIMTMTPNDAAPQSMTREYLKVGGTSCDFCSKTLQEFGRANFHQCERCMMAYYCSHDCQRKSWKAGHKQACRQPGQIETNDTMILFVKDTNLAQYHGMAVKVAACLDSGVVSVQVLEHGSECTLTVFPENLRHARQGNGESTVTFSGAGAPEALQR